MIKNYFEGHLSDSFYSFLLTSHHFHIAVVGSDLHSSLAVFLLQEREEDQRILVLTFEALRLLGNAIVALSDLRLNLLGPVPRHLHVLRPFSHYAAPVTLPGAVHHHIPVQVRTCKYRHFRCISCYFFPRLLNPAAYIAERLICFFPLLASFMVPT